MFGLSSARRFRVASVKAILGQTRLLTYAKQSNYVLRYAPNKAMRLPRSLHVSSPSDMICQIIFQRTEDRICLTAKT